MLAVFLKNPITSILGVLLVLAISAAGIQSWRLAGSQEALASLKASIATEAALTAQKVQSAKDADAEKTQALAEQANQIKDAVRSQISDSVSAFAKVASNPVCNSTPAASAFDSRLRAK